MRDGIDPSILGWIWHLKLQLGGTTPRGHSERASPSAALVRTMPRSGLKFTKGRGAERCNAQRLMAALPFVNQSPEISTRCLGRGLLSDTVRLPETGFTGIWEGAVALNALCL